MGEWGRVAFSRLPSILLRQSSQRFGTVTVWALCQVRCHKQLCSCAYFLIHSFHHHWVPGPLLASRHPRRRSLVFSSQCHGTSLKADLGWFLSMNFTVPGSLPSKISVAVSPPRAGNKIRHLHMAKCLRAAGPGRQPASGLLVNVPGAAMPQHHPPPRCQPLIPRGLEQARAPRSFS